MPNPFRRSVSFPPLRLQVGFQHGTLVPALLLCLLSLTAGRAIAQTSTTPPTGLEKQLNRVDLAVSVTGIFSNNVTGTNYVGVTLTQTQSNTVGELATLRYVAKPLVGFEFNFGNVRRTQNYNTDKYLTSSVCPNSTCTYLVGGAQTGVHEETLGYVAHLHPLFGIVPYVGAGGGTIRFKPTVFGGQGLTEQYRAVYYYNGGLEDTFPNSHLGVRLGFRQLIYLDPDFGQNYLTITRRSRTSEPTFGFFLRF
jgi:hypothetical protein